VNVGNSVKRKAPPTDTVTIRLLVETIHQYEAVAAARSLSRSKYMALVLEGRVPIDDGDHALASLGRIIAIHEEAQRRGVDAELICELRGLVSTLARAVRSKFDQ
jgi:hypothetical protein